jgi:hypothetical protein
VLKRERGNRAWMKSDGCMYTCLEWTVAGQ